MAIGEVLDVRVDVCRNPSAACGIELHGFDCAFVTYDSDLDFLTGNGTIDFICKRLLKMGRGKQFLYIGN